jgi:hypothetical protein
VDLLIDSGRREKQKEPGRPQGESSKSTSLPDRMRPVYKTGQTIQTSKRLLGTQTRLSVPVLMPKGTTDVPRPHPHTLAPRNLSDRKTRTSARCIGPDDFMKGGLTVRVSMIDDTEAVWRGFLAAVCYSGEATTLVLIGEQKEPPASRREKLFLSRSRTKNVSRDRRLVANAGIVSALCLYKP